MGDEDDKNGIGSKEGNGFYDDEEGMKRMMYYYQLVYVDEGIPQPPQLFSDENPNAHCIS